MPTRVLVTCGPSYEPIDDVRRITNFSSGELGVMLAEALHGAGHRVTCLMGEAATWRTPANAVKTRRFATNADLAALLREEGEGELVGAVFHCAALCDFAPVRAAGARRKLDSHGKGLTLKLEPTPKLIASMRELFPRAVLVGWKYELDGCRDDVLIRGQEQMNANRTDACVVNGAAYGPGFGLLPYSGDVVDFPDKPALCAGLVEWLGAKL